MCATHATLDANNGSRRQNGVCYPINTMVATRWNKDDNRTAQGPCVYKDLCPTEKAAGVHSVCYLESYQDITGPLMANSHPGSYSGQDAYSDMLVTQKAKPPRKYIIRRLTPLECCRLQGFPDWWCDDLVTDEPTDEDMVFWREVFETHRKVIGTSSKPKTDAQIVKWLKQPRTDSAEYKMWGNGIALPNAEYVIWCAKKLIGDAK